MYRCQGKKHQYDGICQIYLRYAMERDGRPMLRAFSKAALKRRHLGYQDLVTKLAEIGIKETDRTSATRSPRGSFTGRVLCAMPRRHRMSHRRLTGVGLRQLSHIHYMFAKRVDPSRKACIETTDGSAIQNRLRTSIFGSRGRLPTPLTPEQILNALFYIAHGWMLADLDSIATDFRPRLKHGGMGRCPGPLITR